MFVPRVQSEPESTIGDSPSGSPFVVKYKVIASSPATALLALVDETGNCHVGQAIAAAPSAGTELRGEPPAVGLRQLRLVETGTPCPVALALVDCDPAAATHLIELKFKP